MLVSMSESTHRVTKLGFRQNSDFLSPKYRSEQLLGIARQNQGYQWIRHEK